jgi:diguanylate cyclase (GGDEF)-like protein
MSDGLALFDGEGRIIYCNEQYQSMFPITGKLRVPGAFLPEILRAAVEQGEQPHIPRDGVDRWIHTVMSALRTGLDEEVHLFDGRWLHVRTKPLAGGNATVVVSDITLIKRAETELRGLTDELKLQATTDALTGLPNRRAIDECLAIELARTKRSGQPFSLVMVDIDHFKAFNDIYGHPAGDACLRSVAGALERTDRRLGDFVGRYGGEEFCAILPDTDEDGAYFFAERLRTAVRDLRQTHAGSEKGVVTISVGVATYAADEIDRTDATLIARADEALYVAKGAGRDRVNGWTSGGSERWPAA